MAGMVVQHNINALNAYNRLNFNVSQMKKASEKLSSGYRINRAGDDAAGLAISEKMRAQIRGLGQAKRNAQDGISMVQTFEGALQETHSILQRMKELAVESANETYDNATDRAAIQLEFDQLNDELNQIADTDFNGVIALNGGVMADGLKAVDGQFDYANKAAQMKEAALAQPADILTGTNLDTGNKLWNTVDEKAYDLDVAKQLWSDLGLDQNTEYVNLTVKVASVDDTTGAVTYEALSAVTDAGKAVDKAQFTIAPVNGDGTTISGHGGFKVTAGGADVIAVMDGTGVKAGDLITLQYTGPGAGNKAPTNVGISDDSIAPSAATISVDTAPTITIGSLTDAEMTEDIADALAKLDGAKITVDIAASQANTTVASTFEVKDAAGTVLFDETGMGAKDLDGDGANDVFLAFATGKLTISALNAAGNAAGTKIAEIDMGKYVNAAAATGTVDFNIAFDEYYAAPADAQPDVAAIATESLANQQDMSVSVADAYNKSTAILTYTEDMTLQVGARTKDAVEFTFKYASDGMGDLIANMDVSSRANGLNTANLSLATQEDANGAIDKIDNAINKVSMVRATFGAIQNRLEHKIENITATSENLTEAESTIRDTDMAAEMMNYTKYNILQQAAQSMLAQANQQPQSILQLLG